MATDGRRDLPAPARRLVFVAAAAVIAALAFGALPSGALLGFDAYPLIAAARMDGLGDLFAPFTDELMGGRYPDGRFYRPLVHLAFALDDLVTGHGLATGWYRVTDVGIAAAAAATLGAIGGRLSGRGSGTGSGLGAFAWGVVTIAVYLLHRAQLDVVPYAPRRADALAVLFVAATVLATLRGDRPWVIGGCVLAALFSKESGIIALPLVFVAALCRPERRTVRDAAVATAAPTAAVVMGLAARFAVLGELGGHAESSVGAATAGAAQAAREAWELFVRDAPGGAVALGLAIALVVLGAARRRPRAVALAAAWVVLALAITAVAGRMHAWYVITFLPGLAVLAGVAAGSAATRRGPLDLAGGAGAVALVALFASASMRSEQRETLRVASSIAADQVARFEAVLEGLDEGADITFAPWVFSVGTGPGAPPVFLHAPYSLQALADLRRPEAGLEVLAPGEARSANARATITLLPGPPPADALPR